MNNIPYVTNTTSGIAAQARLQALQLIPLTEAELAAAEDRTERPSQPNRLAEQWDERYSARRQARENRRRILETAALLWSKHGTLSQTVRELAHNSQVSHQTIYNLVGKREKMLTEIMTNHVERLNERVCTAAGEAAEAPAPERLEAMLTAFLEGVAHAPHAHFLLQHGLAGMVPRAREMVKVPYRALLEVLGEPLEQLAPSLDGKQAATLALATVGAMADALLWFDPQPALEVPATARRMTLMLLAAVGSAEGIGPRPDCGGPVKSCALEWLAGGESAAS